MPTLNDRSTSDLALGAVLGSAATVAATVLLKKGMAHSGSSSRVSSGHSVLTQMLSFFERSWGVTSLNEGKDLKSLDSEIMKFADPSGIREAMVSNPVPAQRGKMVPFFPLLEVLAHFSHNLYPGQGRRV